MKTFKDYLQINESDKATKRVEMVQHAEQVKKDILRMVEKSDMFPKHTLIIDVVNFYKMMYSDSRALRKMAEDVNKISKNNYNAQDIADGISFIQTFKLPGGYKSRLE